LGHRANDAVGPLKNEPIDGCDRATVRIDYNAHLNVAVIEDTQYVYRSLLLWFCQRNVSGRAYNCVDGGGRQKNRQSALWRGGCWVEGWRLGKACDRYEEKAQSKCSGPKYSWHCDLPPSTQRALGPWVAWITAPFKRSYNRCFGQKHVVRKIGSLGLQSWWRPASAPRLPQMSEGKYTIELCSPGGPNAGLEGVITSDDDLTTARELYRLAAAADPERVILLCDGGRILARSDHTDTMPD
jgi:hypothetical protein